MAVFAIVSDDSGDCIAIGEFLLEDLVLFGLLRTVFCPDR
jgi:hypothetical protein